MHLHRSLLRLVPLLLAVVGAGACTTIPAPRPEGAVPAEPGTPFDHALLDRVLARHVDGHGRVDYAALRADPSTLDAYYARLAAVSPDSHPGLFPDPADQLAYWINAYNATAIQTVLHHYPIDSVRDVGRPWLFFYPLAGFFYLQRVELGGRKTNLYDLENGIVRERFDDPRIHFALNCASLGCPRLPAHAFHPDRLQVELDEETRRFVAEPRNVSIEPAEGRITLSSIFDWYAEDFTGWMERNHPDRPATLVGYVALYVSSDRAALLEQCADCAVRFADYDWSLNDQATAPPRR